HILNPHTQESPRHIAAVWVIAKTALIADALTTALYFVEPEKLETEFLFEYLVMFKDATVNKSNGFNAELFC
ncbi:MAG: FAD:protein FMN transferase, partial [Patescibacteria group bacterium]